MYFFCGLTSATFVGVGYLLYFSALWLPVPQWMHGLTEALVPLVGSLRSAARVANEAGANPFPAQLMITYGVIGCLLLPFAFCWHVHLSPQRRTRWLDDMAANNATNRRLSRVRLFLHGAGLTLASPLYVAFWFADTTAKSIGWRAHLLYSDTFWGVTFFQLLFPALFGMLVLLSTLMLAMSFRRQSN